MTIEFDAGHYGLLIVIGVMFVRDLVTSFLVKKERDNLTNKMLASKGDGAFDTYVAGVKRLEEPIRTEPTLEEATAVLERWEMEDSVDV